MTMREYWRTLDANDKREFAKRSGTTPNYCHQIAGGTRRPSVDLCRKFEVASARNLTREMLRPDLYR